MAENLLLNIGAISLGGAAAVVVLALAERIFRFRYAPKWRCWIWLLLCVRMLLPFSFVSMSESERKAPIQIQIPIDTEVVESIAPVPTPQSTPVASTQTPTPTDEGNSWENSINGDFISEEQPAGDEQSSGTRKGKILLPQILIGVWLTGVVVMIICLVVAHIRFLRYVKRWERRVESAELIGAYNRVGDLIGLGSRPALRMCGGLYAPVLAGLVRPMLLLPDRNEDVTVKYVLMHELMHYKRHDIWLKALALVVNAFHWFNPFVWYMVRLVERDTELACDNAVLSCLSVDEHGAYGRTILDAVEQLNK